MPVDDLENKSDEELEALADLLMQAIESRKQANPLATFVPTGKQEELIRAVGADSRKWIFVLPAANSSGKTATAINILGAIIWGPQSPWFDYPRFKEWKFPKKFWYISEQTTLKETIIGTDEVGTTEFRKWFPPEEYSLVKAGYDYYSKLITKNGWVGTFKSVDMDTSKFESDKIGVAIFDEPCPEPIFNATLARLTLGGIVIMPMTPLSSSAWIKDRLVDKSTPDNHIFVLQADIEAACRVHGVRGYLDHDQIERIIAEYDDDERAARAGGSFMHLSGLVYKGLHPAVHLHAREPEEFNQKDYRILNVVDPHDVRPPSIGWFAVDRAGNAFMIDEFPEMPAYGPFHKIVRWQLTTKDICAAIRDKEQEYGWDPNDVIRVMDPNFGKTKNPEVGLTTQQIFFRHGRDLRWPLRFYTNVNDDMAEGHRAVKDLLAITSEGKPRLLIGKNCEQAWFQLLHYSRKPRSPKRAEVDGLGERVGEKFKDFPDVVRYFAMYLRGPKALKEPPQPLPEHYGIYGYRPGDEEKVDWRDPFRV